MTHVLHIKDDLGTIVISIDLDDQAWARIQHTAKLAGYRSVGFWIKDTLNVATDPESGFNGPQK